MIPNAITLRNYRSFADPVRLELRPVTLLFGVNNAGKSALLRALPLLGDSVGVEASGPLNLESRALRGGTFHDLRWKGPLDEEDDPDLGIGLHWQEDKAATDFELSLHWFDEGRRLMARRFAIREGDDCVVADWDPRREERSVPQVTYEVRTNGDLTVRRVEFRGLLPESEDAALDRRLASVRRLVQEGLRDGVQWLTSTRRLPESRPNAFPSGPRWRMRPDGEDVGAVLATQPEVLADVSAWYERSLRRRLEIREVPPGSYRLVLRGIDSSAFDIDLIDTGEGMIQVLAVLTALALSLTEEGPSIVAIEEPESHLHPELQRALAEEICDLAAQAPQPRVVLETHSEHLLLGVQLQIVRRRLSPDDVIVYWVRQLDNGRSVAEPIVFDREARPVGNSLPRGVFSHDTDVAREIIRERSAR